MTRDEVLSWVGKPVSVTGEYSDCTTFCIEGYLLFNKVTNTFFVNTLTKWSLDTFSEKCLIGIMNRSDVSISAIKSIIEVNLSPSIIPIHEYFGHEIGDWLSKPIQEVSINLSKYPHICRKCNSPAWVNPVTNHTDCSNKNCK